MANKRVGLIGVGLLGTALAERMHQAGFVVTGYDVNWNYFDQQQRQRPDLAATVSKMASAEQVASQHDTIVMCLPDSSAVEFALGEIEDRLTSGALIIDATTGDPDATAALASRLAARGVGYIDATIAGSSDQARWGEAVVMIGGALDDVHRADEVLKTWSGERFHVGAPGSGARVKLIVNLVLGLNRAVLAEGLSLAKCCGVDTKVALDVLKATPAYSKVMDTKGSRMIAGDYTPQARLAQHLKDVRLIRDLAHRNNGCTPLTDLHETLLQAAVDLGYADADNSAIIEAFK